MNVNAAWNSEGFHDVISKDHEVFKPEANRYILYVSYACPFASRTLVAHKVKKLDDFIRVVVVAPEYNEERLWQFTEEFGLDPFINAKVLRDIYMLSSPNFSGRPSVPVLFDTQTKRIVNNDSAEIIRIFNTGFNELLAKPTIDLYPEPLRQDIDSLNKWTFSDINIGVYRAGYYGRFIHTQQEHEDGCKDVFAALDRAEAILAKSAFLAGDVFTEADIRLFTTVVRMPTVYELHFKCNLKTLRNGTDYPNIFNWVKKVYQIPGVAETVRQDHIKRHYYKSMKEVNPSQFVPLYSGPDWSQPTCPIKDSDFAWCK